MLDFWTPPIAFSFKVNDPVNLFDLAVKSW
jgi:hypothetical protein